jgi:hypothetical protein
MWIMALLVVGFMAGCGEERGVLTPTLTSISANRGTQGQTLNVTLTGTSFTTGATINVGGALITVTNTTVVSSTQITATFAIATNAVLGAVNISVTSSGMTTNTVTFTIGPPFTVTSTVPINGADGVPITQVVSATFSQAVGCATVTTSSYTLKGPSGAVTGTVTCSGSTATFTPTAVLASNAAYTATLTTAVQDSLGDPLLSNYTWSFATAAAPAVTSTIPANGATLVPINQVLTVVFNELVQCSTVTGTSFTLTGPGGAVPGTVICLGTSASSATFTPTTNLAINSNFTATITTAVKNSGGAGLASNYVWSFQTGATPDTIPPTVTAVTPLNLATGVGFNTAVTAMFDEAMAPGTMNVANFTLATGCAPAGTLVGAAVTYNPLNNIITLTPTSSLAPLTCYTATVTTGVTNIAGYAMAANFVWTFTTGAAPDLIPPTVISTVPLNLATNVPLNQAVTATFSKAMLDTTINTTTFTLAQGATPVAGVVSYVAGSDTAIFTPNSNLTTSTLYTATITTGTTDLAGNHLVTNYVWTFTTAAPLLAPPTVLSTNPVNNATGVCTNGINATFSTPMNAATINAATFLVTAAGLPVTGTVTMDVTNTIATFTPLNPLTASTTYVVTITTGVEDLALTPLAVADIWSFTTGTAIACAPPPPPSPLGAAAPFGAFGGGAGVTNQGVNTVINGDIGTTGASTTTTGFHDHFVTYLPPAGCIYTETPLNIGNVTGQIFTAAPPPTVTCPNEGTGPATLAGTTAYVALQAYNAALAEYNTLAGMATTGPDPGAATSENLGGLTIPPGVYKSASGAYDIAGSDLTLDAQGNANAVWVFQMATSLTVGAAGAPRNIILINGASAANVYWQVGSAATINAAGGDTFVGTVISSAGISVSTAGVAAITTINGRLIALGASTTLVNTVINVPGF